MDKEKQENQTIEVKFSLPEPAVSEPVTLGYYRETLKFLGKISLPAVLVVAIFVFESEISKIIPNINKASFFGISVSMNEKEQEFVEFVVQENKEEAAKLAKNIPEEKIQELVDIRGQSIDRSKILPTPVKAEPIADKEEIPEEIKLEPKPSWEVVMDISWVKPNDIFGNVYFLEIEEGMYLWPTELDQQNGIANILINTSNKGRKKGTLLEAATVREGEEYLFTHNSYEYSLRLVDIRKAGAIKTLAGYFYVQKRKL